MTKSKTAPLLEIDAGGGVNAREALLEIGRKRGFSSGKFFHDKSCNKTCQDVSYMIQLGV